MEMEQQTAEQTENLGKGPRIWLIILVAVVLIGLCIGSLLVYQSVYSEETWFVPGDASNFDPIAAYEEVKDFAGDNVSFIGMVIYQARSDGTLNLKSDFQPRPFVEYYFVEWLDEKDAVNVPPGVSGGTPRYDGVPYELVRVKVSKPFQTWSRTTNGNTNSWVNFGMDRDHDIVSTGPLAVNTPDATFEPAACSLKHLFDIAIEQHNAPPDGRAYIVYNHEGYQFRISGTDVNFEVTDLGC